MPNTITNYGTEVCGTLTRRHDSSPYYQGGQDVVAQPCLSFAWYVGKNFPAIEDHVSITISNSDGHPPAVMVGGANG